MSERTASIPNYIKLLSASVAGISGTLVCYPLDVLRLNMQVAGEGGKKRIAITTTQFAKLIIKRDGIRGLYNGISASVARQGMYTGTRLGLFQILQDMYSKDNQPISFIKKCLLGSIAGAVGAIIGLPPDVILTRMAVDNSLPVEKRRNYKHVIDGVIQIYHNEGILVLYRGTTPTIARAVVVNVSQVVSYFQAKEILISQGVVEADDSLCQFLSSVVSSFVATVCTLPIDITKTRIQNMRIIDGKPEYRNMLDVWFKLFKHEGFFALWKGFTPLFFRNAPQFIVTFTMYEKCIDLYNYLYK